MLTHHLLPFLVLISTLAAVQAEAVVSDSQDVVESDDFRIELPDRLRTDGEALKSSTARVLLLLCENKGRFKNTDPLDAPFFSRPQPIASISANDLAEKPFLTLGDGVPGTVSTPDRLDQLNGEFNIRAVLDYGRSRSHYAAGNLISKIVPVTLNSNEPQTITIPLDKRIPENEFKDTDHLKWIEIESEVMTRAGYTAKHRAGVVLPDEYHEPLANRRYWPTIYVIPGFGGDHRDAERYARILSDSSAKGLIPQAVWVVLNPESPLGHHGFVNSLNNGPWESALVEEFIPWLENRFRLLKTSEARILTGHSSGGWSALWLQLQYPEIFGGCFSSSPDPVSFSHFGAVNLYRDPNLFLDVDGELRPSMRIWLRGGSSRVVLTIEDEISMEHAISPNGTSGEQWAAWNAMFSSRDKETGLPVMAYDETTGEIDHVAITKDWMPFDIAQMSKRDWPRYEPIFRDKVRILCGNQDSFYLERAVGNLKRFVDNQGKEDGSGYIEILENHDHNSIVPAIRERWYREMRKMIADAPLENPPPAKSSSVKKTN